MGRLIWAGCVLNGIDLPTHYWKGRVVVICSNEHRTTRRLLQALDLDPPRWTRAVVVKTQWALPSAGGK